VTLFAWRCSRGGMDSDCSLRGPAATTQHDFLEALARELSLHGTPYALLDLQEPVTDRWPLVEENPDVGFCTHSIPGPAGGSGHCLRHPVA
jgi:hypothetical protein